MSGPQLQGWRKEWVFELGPKPGPELMRRDRWEGPEHSPLPLTEITVPEFRHDF